MATPGPRALAAGRWSLAAGRPGEPEWVQKHLPAMLANVGGSLALVIGLVVLLLPLLTPELSRPRDAAWGALVLLLGLALVTSSDRLTGSPMVVVVCAGLLIGRLATEVGQARWRQLSPEEQQRLGSLERWSTALAQLGQTGLGLVGQTGALAGGLGGWLAQHRPGARRSTTKRWVRPALEPAAVPLAVVVSADGNGAEAVAAEPVAVAAGVAPAVAVTVVAVAAAAESVTAESGAGVVDVSPGPGGSRGDGAG
jgi:hypothetical protein